MLLLLLGVLVLVLIDTVVVIVVVVTVAVVAAEGLLDKLLTNLARYTPSGSLLVILSISDDRSILFKGNSSKYNFEIKNDGKIKYNGGITLFYWVGGSPFAVFSGLTDQFQFSNRDGVKIAS